jgi:hypothetical protein
MKKEWTRPQLSDLRLQMTENRAGSSGVDASLEGLRGNPLMDQGFLDSLLEGSSN